MNFFKKLGAGYLHLWSPAANANITGLAHLALLFVFGCFIVKASCNQEENADAPSDTSKQTAPAEAAGDDFPDIIPFADWERRAFAGEKFLNPEPKAEAKPIDAPDSLRWIQAPSSDEETGEVELSGDWETIPYWPRPSWLFEELLKEPGEAPGPTNATLKLFVGNWANNGTGWGEAEKLNEPRDEMDDSHQPRVGLLQKMDAVFRAVWGYSPLETEPIAAPLPKSAPSRLQARDLDVPGTLLDIAKNYDVSSENVIKSNNMMTRRADGAKKSQPLNKPEFIQEETIEIPIEWYRQLLDENTQLSSNQILTGKALIELMSRIEKKETEDEASAEARQLITNITILSALALGLASGLAIGRRWPIRASVPNMFSAK